MRERGDGSNAVRGLYHYGATGTVDLPRVGPYAWQYVGRFATVKDSPKRRARLIHEDIDHSGCSRRRRRR
jgi:hypothetical protein